MWKQTGVKPAELDKTPLPLELQYLGFIFWEIWDSEGWSWNELYYYQRIHEIELDVDEIYLLRDAFSHCSKFVRTKMRSKQKKTPHAPASRGGRK